MTMPRTAAALAAALLLAVPAFAHPHLLVSTPAAGSTAGDVRQASLTFSEPLVAPVTGIDLTMTAMPGMAHHAPMKVTGFKTAIEDRTVIATFPRALPAGRYRLDWHAVSTDTHRLTGTFTFTVE